jgi:rhodanese-related sulfurtransferase
LNVQQPKSISVRELYALSQRQPIELIDVRTLEEYREVRTPLARHVPMHTIELENLMSTRSLPPDEPVYFVCHVGGRSGRVCEALLAAGYSNVVNVTGGMDAWETTGLPVERG